ADRFLMSNIYKRVLPYLKDHSLPEESLEHGLIVADRVPNNQEILPGLARLTNLERRGEENEREKKKWLLEKKKIKSELENEKKKKPDYVKMKKLIESDGKNIAGFHLICYDSTCKTVEHEDYFRHAFQKS
ncbi:hypothetical protein PFISCL1PPCAC_25589, partial [Pristionchus fissidentatus]